MSRRDTILVAILINAGLLVILLIAAITSDHSAIVTQEDITISSYERTSDDAEKKDITLSSQKDTESGKESSETARASKPALVLKKTSQKDDATFLTVTVKRGDFLEKIAQANDVTIEELMKLNKLSDSQLQIGQKLRIPKPDKKEIAKEDDFEAIEKDATYYTIENGDNPWLIAIKHRIKLDDLLKLNELDEYKARRLKPGDKIRIR
jgi:peptidoglycan DL-endopeptidase LytF